MSSEILQADGSTAAVKLAEIHGRVILKASWPFKMDKEGGYTTFTSTKGIQLSAKTREEHSCCLTAASHCARCWLQRFRRSTTAPCPTPLFGATTQRGADYAAHILVTLTEVCRKRKKSFFVLSVELVKAFDQVIRELVFGIPPGVTDVSRHVRDLGLTETADFCGQFH